MPYEPKDAEYLKSYPGTATYDEIKEWILTKPCYGYKKNDQGELVCDAYQAAVVSHIFELYLAGKSYSGIIDVLAEEHIPSPRGSERWSKRAIETVLTNAKYTGNVEVLKSNPTDNRYVLHDAHMAIMQDGEICSSAATDR